MVKNIHPQAIVEEGAQIGDNVTVEPFAVVKRTVILKDNVMVKSHAYLDGFTTVEEGTIIWPGAIIGTKTQDLKYRGEKSFVVIGKNCEIRESATINSSCRENSTVKIGDNCLIMANCHVAHDCELGNYVVMANGSMLAGHVIVEDNAVIGGMTPIHQFCRIGTFAMVGGFSRVSHDVPPYTVGGGVPYKLGGINLIGLKRHKKFPLEVRNEIFKAFKLTYRSGLSLSSALVEIRKLDQIPEIRNWIRFCESSKRGLIGLHGVARVNQLSEKLCEELK